MAEYLDTLLATCKNEYNAGIAAYDKGKTIHNNPFNGFLLRGETPDRWDAWREGWKDGQRMSDEAVCIREYGSLVEWERLNR
jgi:hypothetical protein